MTLLDIKNQILNLFLSFDSFSVKDDMGSLNLQSLDLSDEQKLAAVRLAVEELVKAGYISNIGDDLYVMSVGLESVVQPVVLTPVVAQMVVDLVNEVCVHEDSDYIANGLALTSRDIEEVCRLCHFLLSEEHSQKKD